MKRVRQPRQDIRQRFAIEYVRNGGNASKAFRKVNPLAATWKRQAIARRASEWMANKDVQATVAEAREAAKLKGIASVEQCAQVLSDILLKKFNMPSERIAAVNALAKLMGYEAPTRSEVNVTGAIAMVHISLEERIAKITAIQKGLPA